MTFQRSLSERPASCAAMRVCASDFLRAGVGGCSRTCRLQLHGAGPSRTGRPPTSYPLPDDEWRRTHRRRFVAGHSAGNSGKRMALRPVTIRRYEDLLAAATKIVEADYASTLQLPEVASRVFCSKRTLERAYELSGTSFRVHLRQVRMERAAALLAKGDLRVGDVADSVGYRQAAQFAKSFHMHFGVLPKHYAANEPSPRSDAVVGAAMQ